ncbi:PREDICTED: uncharacterized protein LOC107065954, partial [Polistes dominula]|uniref:Uncharacterized protein LOC107065954 n=1 Tax=Polistes dominula TaxID=743375 RepID=A0ABM1I5U9_POLDO
MSCFGSQEKQIYLVEVLIDKVQLTLDKIKEIGEQSVTIKVKLLDLPIFEITREDFESIKIPPIRENGIIKFSIGRSCLFIRRPKELVEELRTANVAIGVFCIGDTYPLAETTVKLSGCLCDQVSMSTNDPENMPKPFSINGGFHLQDPGENPSGMLDMNLKITCLGRFITTKYELRPNFFVFKKQDDMREFCVERNIPPHVCENLIKANYPLPESIHEKLISKPEVKVSDQQKKKKKGSKKRKKRNNDRLRGGGGGGGSGDDYYPGTSTPIDIDDNIEFTWYGNKIIKENNRLEGGGYEYELPGCVCSGSPSLYKKPEESSKQTSSCKSGMVHLKSAKPGCTCAGKDLPPVWNKGGKECDKKPCTGIDCLLRAFKEAQEFVDSLGKVPGLEGLGLMDPSESPFFGRDISKDYETDETQLEKRAKLIASQIPSPNPQCTAPCNPRFVTNRFDTKTDNISMAYTTPTPLTIAVPGRTGIVREAVPTIHDNGSTITYSKPKKKEEKREDKTDKSKETDPTPPAPLEIDLGPCGEPKCKSRLKKNTSKIESVDNIEHSTKKSTTQIKSVNAISVTTPLTGSKASDKGKHHKSKANFVGASGDRNIKTPIKVSKRIMRYVYSIGDVYPGVHYGHKNCIDVRMRVPANMGWLWNTSSTLYNLKPRIGWKPGAIGKYLSELLTEAKAGSIVGESRPRSVPSRTRRTKAYRSMSFTSVKKLQAKKENDEEAELPPTLHIHRKDGTYYVTMYPIKQETMDVPKLEEPMKPLQFKIVKNKDDESVASSSTASDMEIEFSPPAAVNRYRKKPDVVHVETQVKQQEILDALKITDTSKKDKKNKKE